MLIINPPPIKKVKHAKSGTHYFIKESTYARLVNMKNDKCCSCGIQLFIRDEVYSKRSGNNLRVRCIKCARAQFMVE